jgi:hypothetical protein
MPVITHDAEMANSIHQTRIRTPKKTFPEMVAA